MKWKQVIVSALILAAAGCSGGNQESGVEIKRFMEDKETGIPAAVRVDEGLLIHTTQLFAQTNADENQESSTTDQLGELLGELDSILKDHFVGQWESCEPGVTAQFSAVGYYFGRMLHQALGVPIGLIDNAWGGSAAEAWVRRDLLEKDPQFKAMMAGWERTEKTYNHDALMKVYQGKRKEWETKVKEAKVAV